jgi:CPA2 family monovalent cation:H+ antiporter-2
MPDHLLHLLAELTAIVGAGAVIAYLGQRLFGIVPLVGFLLTGVVIGPHALGLVTDEALVESAAEIGVIFLLFTIGIEFSLEKLARIRRLIVGGGALQMLLTVTPVAVLLMGFGVSWEAAVYTGCLAALSSTVIVLKLLADTGRTSGEPGQAAMGVLIFQDMAVVGIVLLLPALAGQGGGLWGVALALGKAIGIIAIVLVLARKTMPIVLERIARACSPDIFLLSLVAICFGTAWIASLAGLGVSLGAFLAGLIVSESSFSEHALSEILPLRLLFSVAFFVSIGMLLDPRFILEQPLLVLAIVLAVLAIKAVATTGSLIALRVPLASSLSAGFLLAQIGEFSFVLERQGRALGFHPAGSEAIGGQAFIAATVVLMIATPALSTLGTQAAGYVRQRSRRSRLEAPGVDDAEAEAISRSGHILIAGYGPRARALIGTIAAAELDLLIMTLSPDGASEAEANGHRVLRGDYARRQILERAGIDAAALMVVADDDPEMAKRVVGVARALRPDLQIIARTDTVSEEDVVRHAGAGRVVVSEGAADRELARVVLDAAGVSPRDPSLPSGGGAPEGLGVRLSEAMRSSARCVHARETSIVFPGTDRVCAACVAAGQEWVHLRLCMTCGHVGCCDSSPGRHARRHFEDVGHPVIKSWEPGEDWAWCFVEQVRL